MTAELGALLPKKLTIAAIRDFLSGEFEPLPLEDVVSYFQAQEKAGLVKLVEKVPEPVRGRKKN